MIGGEHSADALAAARNASTEAQVQLP